MGSPREVARTARWVDAGIHTKPGIILEEPEVGVLTDRKTSNSSNSLPCGKLREAAFTNLLLSQPTFYNFGLKIFQICSQEKILQILGKVLARRKVVAELGLRVHNTMWE